MLDFVEKPSLPPASIPGRISGWLGQIPAAWKVSLVVFLAGRVFFSLWGALIWRMRLMPDYQGPYYFDIRPIMEGAPGALLGMWQRWDAIHYQRIATYGYLYPNQTTFFPLYPLLARGLASISGISPLLALLLVSNLAFLLCLVALYQLVDEIWPGTTARKTLFNLIIYPGAFFLYAVYPQSLLLLWVLLSYRAARQGRWLLAALLSLLAGLTHPTAAALSVLLGVEAFSVLRRGQPGWQFSLLAPLASLAGIGGFMLWRSLAGFGGYVEVQQSLYNRGFYLPWQSLAAAWRYIIHLPFDLAHGLDWINVLVLALLLVALALSFRRLPLSMTLYQAALLFILTITYDNQNPLLGVVRYPVTMFPVYILLGQIRLGRAGELLKFFFFVLFGLICSAAFLMWKGGIL